MPIKRKFEPNAMNDAASKRIRFSEWLSDAENNSDSSENDEKDDSRGLGSDSDIEGEAVVDEKSHESLETEDSGSDSEQIVSADEVPATRLSTSTQDVFERKDSKSLTRKGTTNPANFTELGVHASLVTALAVMSIRKPTPVQAACIPQLLKGEIRHLNLIPVSNLNFLGLDCIGTAKTGSGKTVAFAIPILQRLIEDPYGIFALVLTPTRYAACSEYLFHAYTTKGIGFSDCRSILSTGRAV